MIVVDSSVVVSIFKNEDDASELAMRILRTERRLMSAANWFEAAIVCEGKKTGDRQSAIFDRLIGKLRIEVVPLTTAQAVVARDAFKRFGKGRRTKAQLNYGDCFAYALAKSLDAPLLFKGKDFAETDVKRA